VQISAGDEGDEYTVVGMDVTNYPASSPYATAVGGTSLEVGKHDERLGEFGWSTGKSVLCTSVLEALEYPGCASAQLNTWLPPAPGAYDYGGGGGTDYLYPEPSYQDAVVPAALAERNSAITHERNRVVPDVVMDGDPSTGLLIGETQEFPTGDEYNEYRLGGTSLSSPLFAGVMADADQAAGKALGFANPLLYQLDSLPETAGRTFYDIVPGGKQAMARNDYLNSINAKEGLLTSVRLIEYEGSQEFCDGTGSCETQENILSTAPGYDSMTGIGSPGEGFIAELSHRP
jgi:subtilase family serine protease